LSQRATVAASGGDPNTISLRVDQRSYVQVYAILIAVLVVMRLSEGWLFARIAIQAARRLHNINFIRVLNGTMAYFDTTPLGRILNRFAGFVHLSLA
jgi:ABC-type bacteriocin/lantibiotic exporter with double-glycine peptidase domain